MKAICINCGTAKSEAWHKCRKCGLVPAGDDLVKSVYCSVGRYAEDPERSAMYSVELEQLRDTLRAGRSINYDSEELGRLKKEQASIEVIPGSSVWGAVLRFFLPALIFLAIIYLAIAFLGR